MIYGIPASYFLILGAILFSIGVFGVLLRKEIIVIFMCVEIMLNSANLVFFTFSKMFGNVKGEVIVVFIMSLAAVEAAVGLAILIAIHKLKKTSSIDTMNHMNG